VTGTGDALVANAWSEDGTLMAMRHRDAPAHGLQFHPESIATPDGISLVRAFVGQRREKA
jgi:anthranilate synthase component 2